MKGHGRVVFARCGEAANQTVPDDHRLGAALRLEVDAFAVLAVGGAERAAGLNQASVDDVLASRRVARVRDLNPNDVVIVGCTVYLNPFNQCMCINQRDSDDRVRDVHPVRGTVGVSPRSGPVEVLAPILSGGIRYNLPSLGAAQVRCARERDRAEAVPVRVAERPLTVRRKITSNARLPRGK